MKTQEVKDYSEGTVRLCAHTIEWWLGGQALELSETDEEHITKMLVENYVEGELCTVTPEDEEVYGWWNIRR